jgi:hypothetical protein
MAAIVNFFKSISPFKSAEPEEEPAPAKKSAKKPAAKKPAKKAPAKKKARCRVPRNVVDATASP